MIISGEIILFIMRTALAYPFEDDEVPVVSIEVLDATVTALRVEVTDLKGTSRNTEKSSPQPSRDSIPTSSPRYLSSE